MSAPIDVQLRNYTEFFDSELPALDLEEALYERVGPGPVQPIRPRQRLRASRWGVAAAAALLILVFVGGIALLSGNRVTDTPVTDDPPVTSTTEVTPTTSARSSEDPVELEEPTLDSKTAVPTEPPWQVEDLPSGAESGTFDTPLGSASWVKLPLDEATRPGRNCFIFDAADGYSGCGGPGVAMPWPTGFALFEGKVAAYPPPARPFGTDRLWVSVNGVEWREEPLPTDPIATGVSIELVDGVYWLMSEEPAGLWHTTDGTTWHEIDPTGLAPPPSVGPTWERGYEPPVTAGELTLTYGSFWGDEYPRDHEQRIYIIGGTEVTPVSVPWPAVVDVTLFSTGKSIYAYTDNGQSEDATMTAWRTTDGRSWAEIGPPSFVETSGLTAKSIHLYPTLDGRLVAWSHELRGAAWETTDGANWDAVDLPPLPSANGARGVSPVLLGSSWYAVTGSQGGYWDGDTWWRKAGDSWFQLTELQISGEPIWASAVRTTTFFFSEQAMWVMSLQPTE